MTPNTFRPHVDLLLHLKVSGQAPVRWRDATETLDDAALCPCEKEDSTDTDIMVVSGAQERHNPFLMSQTAKLKKLKVKKPIEIQLMSLLTG